MNILLVNSGAFGSTGSIAKGIAKTAIQKKHNVFFACPDNRLYPTKECLSEFRNVFVISGLINRKISYEITKITGLDGMLNILHTYYLCSYIKRNKIELIHFHNLHMGFLNLPILFRFIKKNDIKVVWTLHDCWAFTGHCPYFTMAKCDKWISGCHNCPSYRDYPSSLYDNSRYMWKLKRLWFTGVKKLTIVTPSQWLADLTKKSYLKEYPVKVINNGIDLNIFRPVPSDFREKYEINDEQNILLGVAFGWEKRKGLDVFIELSKRLNPEKYKIVLVGTNDKIDDELPKSIISIHRTQNQNELAEIYTASDVFVNPTREENFPTVNMEAIACGTPVVTFKTGGSPESIDENTGIVVERDNIEELESAIFKIISNNVFYHNGCLLQSQNFNKNNRFDEYVRLYESL